MASALADSSLSNGDIIHVAHKELRFGFESAETSDDVGGCYTEPAVSQLPASVIRSSNHLREMLSSQSVRTVFQPIVRLDTLDVLGFEALGRGAHSELSTSPSDLFGLADRCRLASELSQLFRTVAVEEASRLPEGFSIFFNLHPSEMAGDSAHRVPAGIQTQPARDPASRVWKFMKESLLTSTPCAGCANN